MEEREKVFFGIVADDSPLCRGMRIDQIPGYVRESDFLNGVADMIRVRNPSALASDRRFCISSREAPRCYEIALIGNGESIIKSLREIFEPVLKQEMVFFYQPDSSFSAQCAANRGETVFSLALVFNRGGLYDLVKRQFPDSGIEVIENPEYISIEGPSP